MTIGLGIHIGVDFHMVRLLGRIGSCPCSLNLRRDTAARPRAKWSAEKDNGQTTKCHGGNVQRILIFTHSHCGRWANQIRCPDGTTGISTLVLHPGDIAINLLFSKRTLATKKAAGENSFHQRH
jgi:hypothetical protein